MRIIKAEQLTDIVRDMCITANTDLPCDVEDALKAAHKCQVTETGKDMLDSILENARIAREDEVPICQDTGMAVFFVEIGNEVFVEGDIEEAINRGVSKGYTEGYLRASVVGDPLDRVNTKDNTPAVIHYSFVSGDKITITIAPKGFGSENKSALKMLVPADGKEGIVEFVKATVKKAGGSPCPPIVVGVGIGGTMEKAALLAKKALTRNVGSKHPKYGWFEEELLEAVNSLGIGVQGLGGNTTALGVNVEVYPTHIAGLPVAVNINCHVTRHKTVVI